MICFRQGFKKPLAKKLAAGAGVKVVAAMLSN